VRNRRRIAVLGRADLEPGTPDYRDAIELGRLIAREGWTAVTGGYGGAMEAVSRGAFEAGGETEGVVCSAFEGRRPNGYLSRQVWTTGPWSLWKSGFLWPRPLVLTGAVWDPILDGLNGAGALEENLLEWTIRAEGTGSALSVLRDALREGSLDGQIQR
jgi:hypothetical protein